MKKLFISFIALAMAVAANAKTFTEAANNFTGTYSNSSISVDWTGNTPDNPVVVSSSIDLKVSTTTLDSEDSEYGFTTYYKLSIKQFNFMGQILDVDVDKLVAIEEADKVKLTTREQYIQGPNAEVGGNEVATVLTIEDANVTDGVLDVNLTVFIAATTPFDHDAWLEDIEVEDDDEAYADAGAIVKVNANSVSADNYQSDIESGILSVKSEKLNIVVVANAINVANAEGESYAIVNANGAIVAQGTVENGAISTANIANGSYIVVVGNATAKFAK